jgi:hypothetical protein
MVKIKLILIVAISATLFLLTLIHVGKQKEATQMPPRVITLSNTDTIYQEIEILKFKSNIIIKTHETKINNYRHATTTNKVQLFADRINRQ